MLHKKCLLPAILMAAAMALPVCILPAQKLPAIQWQSPAQLKQVLNKSVHGNLLIDDIGIEFGSPKFSRRWLYEELKTFDLTGARELVITDYENRQWHVPGERQFRFALAEPMPADTTAAFAIRVGRPVINGNPPPQAGIIAELPAHRRELWGGSNGMLRLREDGIDYVVSTGRAGRSWRWNDIQTIAHSSDWDFRVTAYREIVEFDLKKPLPIDLFNRLWDNLYTRDLNVSAPKAALPR